MRESALVNVGGSCTPVRRGSSAFRESYPRRPPGTIEVDERELARNEQARADREEESDAEEDPLRHRCLPERSRARVYGRAYSQREDRPWSIQYIGGRPPAPEM